MGLWLLITSVKDTLVEVIVKNRGAAVLRTVKKKNECQN